MNRNKLRKLNAHAEENVIGLPDNLADRQDNWLPTWLAGSGVTELMS